MQFEITSDQKLFADTFRSLLEAKCSSDDVRKSWEEGAPIENLWHEISEMGALSIFASEADGGLGLSEVEMALLMEEAGRAALPEPFLEHTVAVSILASILSPSLGNSNSTKKSGDKIIKNQIAELPEIFEKAISEEIILSPTNINSEYVAYGNRADFFLLAHRPDHFHLLEKDAVTLHTQKSIDEPRNPTKVEYDPSKETAVGGDPALAFNRGAVGAAAICLGTAQKLLDTTVEYVKERKQFGTSVGTQQAVKHHLANVAISIEHARPNVYAAAWHLACRDDLNAGEVAGEVDKAVSSAKALASDAANLAAKQALQCHGAIAYTIENDLNFWMKQAWVAANSWGNSAFHLNRISNSL